MVDWCTLLQQLSSFCPFLYPMIPSQTANFLQVSVVVRLNIENTYQV